MQRSEDGSAGGSVGCFSRPCCRSLYIFVGIFFLILATLISGSSTRGSWIIVTRTSDLSPANSTAPADFTEYLRTTEARPLYPGLVTWTDCRIAAAGFTLGCVPNATRPPTDALGVWGVNDAALSSTVRGVLAGGQTLAVLAVIAAILARLSLTIALRPGSADLAMLHCARLCPNRESPIRYAAVLVIGATVGAFIASLLLYLPLSIYAAPIASAVTRQLTRDGFIAPTDGVTAGAGYSNCSFAAFLSIVSAFSLLLAACMGPCQWIRGRQISVVGGAGDGGAPPDALPPGYGGGPVNYNPRGYSPFTPNGAVVVFPQGSGGTYALPGAAEPANYGEPSKGQATFALPPAGATIAMPPPNAGAFSAHPIFNVRSPSSAIPVATYAVAPSSGWGAGETAVSAPTGERASDRNV